MGNHNFDLLALAARVPGAFRRMIADRRHRKRFSTAPVYTLGDLPEGTFGKVTGLVRPYEKRLIEAPLSGRVCVYYDISIDAMVREQFVRVLASEQEAVPFVLEAEDHRAVVDASHATISVGIDHVSTSTLRLASARQARLLERLGLAGRRISYGDSLRYREATLEADERIALVACGVRELDPQAPPGAGYRESGQTRLRLTGTARYPLMITDDPRAVGGRMDHESKRSPRRW